MQIVNCLEVKPQTIQEHYVKIIQKSVRLEVKRLNKKL